MSLFRRVAIVGVGLIGGSIGLAITRRGLAQSVVGIGRQAKTLAAARELGAIQETSLDLATGVAGADLVLVCTPVGRIAADVVAAAEHLTDALVSDVGSTKAGIVARRRSGSFAPRARGTAASGSWADIRSPAASKRGSPTPAAICSTAAPASSRPPPRPTRPTQSRLTEFWTALGARVVKMPPDGARSGVGRDQPRAARRRRRPGRRHAAGRRSAGRRRLARHDADRRRRRVACGSRSCWPIRPTCWRRSTSSKRNWPPCDRRSSVAMPAIWKNSWPKPNRCAMLWEVDIYPLAGQPDRAAHSRRRAGRRSWASWPICSLACARGYLIQGDFDRAAIERAARGLLVDTVVERAVVGAAGRSGAASSRRPVCRDWFTCCPSRA